MQGGNGMGEGDRREFTERKNFSRTSKIFFGRKNQKILYKNIRLLIYYLRRKFKIFIYFKLS